MCRVLTDLDVQHGGQPAQALRTHAQCIDAIDDLEAQRFELVLRSARAHLGDVHVFQQRLFGHDHGLLGGTTDAYAQHAGRAPARAHLGDHLAHKIDDRVGRVEHAQLGLVLRAATLGRNSDL